ncbi:MAG TPA: hypothetical protein VKE94_23820 [Gemmataceae bacterium]|nr:hypothetical protein [Gemmataceae bacterium]
MSYIGGGLVALFVLLLFWGFLHKRHSKQKALEAILQLELGEIEPLTRECAEVFERKLGVRLNLDDCDDAAQKLDDAFRDPVKLKGAFERPGFYWYFVKPIGACLGELLRRYAKHEWRKQTSKAPFMEVRVKGGASQVFPFEKVIKQVESGEPGDLVAYVTFARTLDQIAERATGD